MTFIPLIFTATLMTVSFLGHTLTVVQQPTASFVPYTSNEVAQFQLATLRGGIGLLAHEQFAGQYFKALKVGDGVILTYSDGRQSEYSVTAIDLYPDTRDEAAMFAAEYLPDTLTLQTCAGQGRYFVRGAKKQ